jgi:phospholipase D1/2
MCWKATTAARATLLIDGHEYFSALRSALLQARRQILIVGWDFDSRIALAANPSSPLLEEESARAPTELGELLGYLTRTRPGLQIHVLRWDYHWIYRDDRELDTRERLERMGVHFYDDAGHPVTGCVHHKLVVIDDSLAFCGGIDLTHKRWDTCDHLPRNPRRLDPSGEPYMPVHDTQLCVTGPIAAALGNYIRDQWPTGSHAPSPVLNGGELWPEGLRVDFHDIPAAICRTLPATDDRPAVREIEAFYLAAIADTKHSLYIENQYFTSTKIAEAIAQRCAERPELQGVLVGIDRMKTSIECHTMGYGRAQFCKVLEQSGAAETVPLVAAITGDQPINLHSKLALFDDRWLMIGSANLNHRSMGFDVECNIALQATTAAHRARIESLRNQLLAEHLDMEPEEIAHGLRLHGLAHLPDHVHRSRRLVRAGSNNANTSLGPLLGPLFDREQQWPIQPVQTPGWQHAAILVATIAGAVFSSVLAREDAPTLASVQALLARLLEG